MTLNNTYTIIEDNIKDVLDKVDCFLTNINKFNKRHNNVSYNIIIKKIKLRWFAEIEIKHEK